ncbi:MAG: CoA transferase [Dehalococcoidales bacterium]|nr:CoA transferase [Dehalococcoidales bacterium]
MLDSLLSGYRALDLTDDKGVFCGKILADMGVDTIKVEKPGGDPMRLFSPFYHDIPDPEKSLFWFAFNSNKRSVTLNLEDPRGQEIFKKLAQTADFVIESFPPGYLAGLGLDYTSLARTNPRLIMTSITPFGQSGPYASLKGSDLVTQALGVLLWQTGDTDRAPVRTTLPQAYMHAGADAAEGTMMAHYYRGQTGEGQQVDVSIMESVLWVGGRALPYWDCAKVELKRSGRYWDRMGRRFPAIWECKDGYVGFLIQGSVAGDKTNESLTEWMDIEAMAPRYMKERDWQKWDWDKITQSDLDCLVESIGYFFKTHTTRELEEGAAQRGIMLNKVCNVADTLASEQLQARDFWVNLEHAELRDNLVYTGAFAKFSLTPLRIHRRAPLIGEHNEEIYVKEFGLSLSQVSDLKTGGII